MKQLHPSRGRRQGGRALGILAVGAVAVSLLAGSAAGAPTRSSAAPNVGSVSLGGVFCTCHTSMYVAWKKGFFAKRGVTVKSYTLTQGGSLTVSGLVGGTFDFGAATTEAVVRSRATTAPLKAIANLYPEFWALAIRQDLRSEIKRVTDLKGKTVGVSAIGSGSWAFLVSLLGKSGIRADEVRIVPLGGLTNILTALKAKRVDASVTWEPGTSAAVRSAIATPIINLQIPGVTQKLTGSKVSMSQVIAAREELLKDKPVLSRAVVAAVRDAGLWLTAKDRKPAEVVEVLRQVAPGTISKGTLLAAAKATLRIQPKTPILSREGYDTSTRLLIAAGSLRPVPFDQVVDCRFAGCGP